MVAVYCVAVNTCIAQASAQWFAYPEVVNTPAGVVRTCSGAVRPPTVHLRRLAEHAERINESRLLPTIHPLAFFRQETADTNLSLRVIDINRLVR